MAERTYSEQEVQDLLERAAELQVQVARRSDWAPGLTLSVAEPAPRTESAALEIERPMDPTDWEDVDTSRSGDAPLVGREKHRAR